MIVNKSRLLSQNLLKLAQNSRLLSKRWKLAPSKVTSDLIRLTMNDSDEVLVPLSEMSKKLPYYSKIKPQLSEPSVVDMEAGIYSYTVADKLIMEAEEKPNKRLRKLRRNKKRKRRKG